MRLNHPNITGIIQSIVLFICRCCGLVAAFVNVIERCCTHMDRPTKIGRTVSGWPRSNQRKVLPTGTACWM